MSNLIQIIKENIKVILLTLLVYQLFLTIFLYSVEHLIILAILTIITAGYVIITNYKDDIKGMFK